MNILEQAVHNYFELETTKEREERERLAEALTPVLGAEDAQGAATLEMQIRTAPRHAMAEAGAAFIRERLNAPSPLRQLMKLDEGVPFIVVNGIKIEKVKP